MLLTYLKNHHTPKRMVVAGVGVQHDEFVKLVEKHFLENKPTWELETVQNRGASLVDSSVAQYTGGSKIVRIQESLLFARFKKTEIISFRKNAISQYMHQLACQNWLTSSSVWKAVRIKIQISFLRAF